MAKALYATNVYHYDHVLMAMSRVYQEVGLVRRIEMSPEVISKLKACRLPAKVVDVLARRVREPSAIPSEVQSLGASQLVLPLLSRSGIRIRPRHTRHITTLYANKVARASRGYDVLHFVEGLGFRSLEQGEFQLSICERRNFHHRVFEQMLEPVAGFPLNGKPDPIGDILSYEYQKSDFITVYSHAAKRSFVEAGFADHKIIVTPIGVGNQLPRIDAKRDPHKLIYVGRGDIHKGIDVAVAAVTELGKPYRLTVAGSMSPAVKSWLSRHNHVDYVGILDRYELRNLYSTAAAMVLPSTESFGLAAAEACYHGLPLICSINTGVAEYLPAGTHTIVAGRDPLVWAAEILKATTSAQAGNMQINPLQGLDWYTAADGLAKVYADLEAQQS